MKLIDKESWYSRVSVEVPILKDISELEAGFPFDIGCVTLENPDGDIIWLDPYATNYQNDGKQVGDKYVFEAKMEIFDLEENGVKDIVFNFKVKDLENCSGTFYVAPDESSEDFFDMENIVIEVNMFMDGSGKPTHTINVLEEE